MRLKKYEIWLGLYNLGQGYDPPKEPELIATVEATTFRVACWRYTLKNALDSLDRQIKDPRSYIEDCHFGCLYYNPEDNSNSWIGKFYETKEEAQKSFK